MAKKKEEPDFDAPIGAPSGRPWEREYLTIDEWVDSLSSSLRAHLKESVWPGSSSERMHPEDLAACSGAFIDAAQHLLAEFGVRRK